MYKGYTNEQTKINTQVNYMVNEKVGKSMPVRGTSKYKGSRVRVGMINSRNSGE